MKNAWELEPQAFEKMLDWLDKDRNAAGQKYETIRLRLIKVLQYRGCSDGEQVADIVFDRVARKMDSLADIYQGDPVHYFLNVANKVLLEHKRNPEINELPDNIAEKFFAAPLEEDIQPEYECLKKCLAKLPAEKREMIVGYYSENKKAKIQKHQQIAKSAGIELPTLHVRAFRLREILQKCVLNCLEQNG